MSLDKIAALKRTALFQELDDETLRLVAERAAPRSFHKDEVLFIAGDKARGLYVIVNGSVRAFRESTDGREQIIHVERVGAPPWQKCRFLDDGDYPSTVAAEEQTDTLFLEAANAALRIDEHNWRPLWLCHADSRQVSDLPNCGLIDCESAQRTNDNSRFIGGVRRTNEFVVRAADE
jgi:CRP-like cAMP-binding protein